MIIEQEQINQNISLANEYINDLFCQKCNQQLPYRSNCDFCGLSICQLCLIKERQFENDGIWHPICKDCEGVFLQRLVEQRFKQQLEESQDILQKKRIELEEWRQTQANLRGDQMEQDESSLKSGDDLTTQIGRLKKKKENIIQCINEQKIEKQKLEEQIIQYDKEIENKKKTLTNLKKQIKISNQEVQSLQEQIENMMENINHLDNNVRNSVLEVSNYNGVFRSTTTRPPQNKVYQQQKKKDDCLIQ